MSFGEDIVKIVEENATGLLGKHASWHRVPAAQVIEIINGFPFKSKGFNNEKGTPVLRIRDILKGKTETFFEGKVDPKACYVSNGDIVIGMDGDFNSCIWQGGLVLINQRVCKVETNQAFYDQKLFSYLLPGYLRAIHAQTSAVTVKHLSSNTIKEIPLPLPPLNEQKRIVDKIEQLFSNIDEGEALLKQVQKQLATYRQSVLKAAVTGKLIGLDANKWPEQTVGQLLKDIRYGTAKKCLFDPSKTPVLRIPNVAGGKIDLSDLKHTDFSETELEKLRLEYGDLLIVRSNGSVSLVGLSAMVTKQAIGYAYAGYLIRLRLKQDILLPDFLNLYLHSPIVRGRIELQARSTSGVHNINSNEVKSIPLRIPPLQRQEEIVSKVDDIFSQIDALESWCALELTRSATLRQSILKDAFSGRLVPQDPNDEPASELLKRIQAERAKTVKTTKQKSSAPPRPRGRRKIKESV